MSTYCFFPNNVLFDLKNLNMKKSVFKHKHKTENCNWPDEIVADGTTYPPLFCQHTWTKSVPICVIYLWTAVSPTD